MGRHAAGHSLLRAVVNAAAQSQSAITACVPDHSAARRFVEQVRELSSRTSARLESINALCDVNRALGLYVPGPGIVRFASLRLRGRIDAYSIVGVTHTIASHAALGSVVELPDSAVMPWDALICTSHSVRQAVNEALQAKIDFLQWRLGFSGSPALPQLPVIPLGVHCADYLIDPSVRVEARSVLGLSNDEVGLLFVGRLSFHAKAHPFPMFVGAEEAAKSTGKKLVLFMCGWFANDAIKEAFVSGAARYFPSGRTVFLEGGCQDTLRRAWAASDKVFSSTFAMNLRGGEASAAQALGDLATVRQFLTGPGLFAFFDTPWLPIYLLAIFFVNVWIGWFALGAMLVLGGLAWANDRVTRKPLTEAGKLATLSSEQAGSQLRNAEVIQAMGMLPQLRTRWMTASIDLVLK